MASLKKLLEAARLIEPTHADDIAPAQDSELDAIIRAGLDERGDCEAVH